MVDKDRIIELARCMMRAYYQGGDVLPHASRLADAMAEYDEAKEGPIVVERTFELGGRVVEVTDRMLA